MSSRSSFQPMDIGRIVSERLAAVRRLQQNPNDVQAISQMRTAQKKVYMYMSVGCHPPGRREILCRIILKRCLSCIVAMVNSGRNIVLE